MINIRYKDKVDLLMILFNNARIQAIDYMRMRDHDRDDMTREEAEQMVRYGRLNIDRHRGRILRVDLSFNDFNPHYYNNANGHLLAERLVEQLQSYQIVNGERFAIEDDRPLRTTPEPYLGVDRTNGNDWTRITYQRPSRGYILEEDETEPITETRSERLLAERDQLEEMTRNAFGINERTLSNSATSALNLQNLRDAYTTFATNCFISTTQTIGSTTNLSTNYGWYPPSPSTHFAFDPSNIKITNRSNDFEGDVMAVMKPEPPEEATVEKIKKDYDEVYNANEGMFAVCLHTMRDDIVIQKEWSFLNKFGKEMNSKKYEDVRFYSEGMAAVLDKGLWGFVDKGGLFYIKPTYADVGEFSDRVVAVSKDGRVWRYVDYAHSTLTEFKYDECQKFKYGFGIVRIGNEYGLVDKSGEEVLSVIYDKIEVVMTEEEIINILVTIGEVTCILDEDMSEIH